VFREDQMIEWAEPREQRLRLVGVCKVQHVALGASRERGERFVDSRLPAGGDHHARPLASCRLCGGQPDARAAAQHDNAFSFKSHVSFLAAFAFGNPFEGGQPQSMTAVHQALVDLAQMRSVAPHADLVGDDKAGITLRREVPGVIEVRRAAGAVTVPTDS
jgi:hypothetical protein